MSALSPAVAFTLYVVAVVMAIVPAVFGPKVQRFAGVALLMVSLSLACLTYPAFKKEGNAYRIRTETKTQKVPLTTPSQPQRAK
jgi:VIT1/CCC1 family predicted Fe2+/Mn2+ transporter